MEPRINETISALGWISGMLQKCKGLDESDCLGLAVILGGLQARLELEGNHG